MWWYTAFVLVLWVVNPELRRLYDWKAGYSALEILAILPLISLIPHVWALTYGGGWQRLPRAVAVAVWLWLGGFTYAFVISILSGNMLSGAYTFAGFVLPVAVGAWVAADSASFPLACKRLNRTLFGLTTFISIYGIIQYTLAPPWDVAWLQNVIAQGSVSFGRPAPFQIRVFSTLNSPGPFAMFLAIVLIIVLPQLSLRRPLLLAQVPVWLVAFGLTLVRTGWLMFGVGAIAYLILTPRRGILLATLGLSAALLTGLFTVLPSVIGNASLVTSLTSRFSTLNNLDDDESGSARRDLYAQAGALISVAPLGQGLGVLGTSTKLSKAAATTDFDSGVLGRLVEMGVPGFILYVAPLLLLVLVALRAWNDGRVAREPTIQSFAAMAIGLAFGFAGEQLGSEAGGLLGLMFWLIMCLAVRAALSDMVASEAPRAAFAPAFV